MAEAVVGNGPRRIEAGVMERGGPAKSRSLPPGAESSIAGSGSQIFSTQTPECGAGGLAGVRIGIFADAGFGE